jgi:hypothetical protein
MEAIEGGDCRVEFWKGSVKRRGYRPPGRLAAFLLECAVGGVIRAGTPEDQVRAVVWDTFPCGLSTQDKCGHSQADAGKGCGESGNG